jgi:hypothetical protein
MRSSAAQAIIAALSVQSRMRWRDEAEAVLGAKRFERGADRLVGGDARRPTTSAGERATSG